MVKLMACLRRKPGMSEEEFHQYWEETHGPLVMDVTEFSRYFRRYIQSHTLQGLSAVFPPQAIPAYDGIAEVWFESEDELQKAFAEPRYLEIIRPDEEKFLDLANCVTFIVEEASIVER